MNDIFTVAHLDKMINLAIDLRFWDDVKHWREVRARLLADEPEELPEPDWDLYRKQQIEDELCGDPL